MQRTIGSARGLIVLFVIVVRGEEKGAKNKDSENKEKRSGRHRSPDAAC
jgi:hypothetical protein